MENLRVYRARFGAGSAMVEPNRHRAATVERALSRPWWSKFPSDQLSLPGAQRTG